MRNVNVVSIDQVRRPAADGRQTRRQRAAATAPILMFPEPPAPFALSAEVIDYAERIELLIARCISLSALDAILRHLETHSA